MCVMECSMQGLVLQHISMPAVVAEGCCTCTTACALVHIVHCAHDRHAMPHDVAPCTLCTGSAIVCLFILQVQAILLAVSLQVVSSLHFTNFAIFLLCMLRIRYCTSGPPLCTCSGGTRHCMMRWDDSSVRATTLIGCAANSQQSAFAASAGTPYDCMHAAPLELSFYASAAATRLAQGSCVHRFSACCYMSAFYQFVIARAAWLADVYMAGKRWYCWSLLGERLPP